MCASYACTHAFFPHSIWKRIIKWQNSSKEKSIKRKKTHRNQCNMYEKQFGITLWKFKYGNICYVDAKVIIFDVFSSPTKIETKMGKKTRGQNNDDSKIKKFKQIAYNVKQQIEYILCGRRTYFVSHTKIVEKDQYLKYVLVTYRIKCPSTRKLYNRRKLSHIAV